MTLYDELVARGLILQAASVEDETIRLTMGKLHFILVLTQLLIVFM